MLFPSVVRPQGLWKKSPYLPDFLVLLLLLFLPLFLCVVVYQGLVPLGQKGKVDFPVTLVIFPAALGGGPPVLVRNLLVVHAVLVPLVFCGAYMRGSVASRCIPVKHWWKRFGLHVACWSRAAAALGDARGWGEGEEENKTKGLGRSGMMSGDVSCMSGSAFQWSSLMRGIWRKALKGVNPSSSQDWPWSLGVSNPEPVSSLNQ